MPRVSTGKSSYGHRCWLDKWGMWWVEWTIDYTYPGSRIRYPRPIQRETDQAGAARFCKRWGIQAG